MGPPYLKVGCTPPSWQWRERGQHLRGGGREKRALRLTWARGRFAQERAGQGDGRAVATLRAAVCL
eukprot:515065-Rhodomonas_salina.2